VRVAGLLEAQPGVGAEQRVGQQVEGLLRADRDQDLLGQREHAALGQHAQADLLDQVGQVVGLEVGVQLGAARASALRMQHSRKSSVGNSCGSCRP
jgi:hypothetical protein